MRKRHLDVLPYLTLNSRSGDDRFMDVSNPSTPPTSQSHTPVQPATQPPMAELLAVLRTYRTAILVGLACLALFMLVAGTGTYLLYPSQKVTRLPFRVSFPGAEQQRYPNGMRFVPADITSTAVLSAVYRENELARFIPFSTFAESIFIVEWNAALEQLAREYAKKLSDPKLLAVDRERMEEEYRLKRESLSKSQFALSFAQVGGGSQIPQALVKKSLTDILEHWSEQVAKERGALRYQLPILTENVIARDYLLSQHPAIALDLLRSKIGAVVENMALLQAVPGAEVLRTPRGNTTLHELRLRLDDVVRARLRPLMMTARDQGLTSEPEALTFFESQLQHNQRGHRETSERLQALRTRLELYQSGSGTTDSGIAAEPVGAASSPTETMIPQVGEAFLDRLVQMSGQKEDREYRQRVVEEIKAAQIATVPYSMEIEFYKSLLDEIRENGGSRRSAVDEAAFRKALESIVAEVIAVIRETNQIYALLSANLNPSSALYTVTEPSSAIVERSIQPIQLFLTGFLVFLVAIPMAIALAFLHHRIYRNAEDIAIEHVHHPSVESPRARV